MTQTQLPKGIFFDWDGTLVDTLPFLLGAHNHVRGVMGLEPWSVDEFKGHVLYSTRDLYGTIYGEREQEAVTTLRAYMADNHLENLEILPDSLALLSSLSDLGIPVGIISNKRHEFLLREVAHLEWDHLSQVTIGAGFAEKDKPAPDPLLLALEECKLTPDMDIWYVGDSETDMRTARAAGCSAVLVRHHHDNENLVEKFNPEYVFDNNQAMQDYLHNFFAPMSKKG